jgi:hypothetical protein
MYPVGAMILGRAIARRRRARRLVVRWVGVKCADAGGPGFCNAKRAPSRRGPVARHDGDRRARALSAFVGAGTDAAGAGVRRALPRVTLRRRSRSTAASTGAAARRRQAEPTIAKAYTAGGRATPPAGPGFGPAPKSFRERLGALRNVPPFLTLVWQTSPALTIAEVVLRLLRALLPVVTLYIGKLIIDEVVGLARTSASPATLEQWFASGQLDRIGLLLAIEFGLAVLSDALGRTVSLLDTLLAEQFSNASSLRLMEHAATLDLEDFEDSELQDRLERARRQTAGRNSLLGQLFAQAQDVITIVSFGATLII